MDVSTISHDELRQRRSKIDNKNENESHLEKRRKSKSFENFMKQKLSGLSPKWQSFTIRTVVTLILLILLPLLILGGFLISCTIIAFIALQCYREYIRVACNNYRADNLPLITFFAYSIYFVTYNTFIGGLLVEYMRNVMNTSLYHFLSDYGKFISFCLFTFIVVVFVLSLKKHYYKRQFTMFGWFLLGSAFLGCSSRCLFKNVRKALIWGFFPMSLIVLNDICAYICGILFGKTPLIKISPKKTWEGFLGAGLLTVIGSLIIIHFLIKFPYFYCPYDFTFGSHQFNTTCKNPSFLQLQYFQLPLIVTLISPTRISSIPYYPIYIHALVIAIFCSLLAPFGGFFASGLKRAYNIKDFGHAFPGHGGMLDRMDCQLFLTIFVNVYTATFVKFYESMILYQKIIKLPIEDLVQLFDRLKVHLLEVGAIDI